VDGVAYHAVCARALRHALREQVQLRAQQLGVRDVARERVLRSDRLRLRIRDHFTIVETARQLLHMCGIRTYEALERA
jgi:hypothetical protein